MTRKSKPPIALYSALADATRCRIVEILAAGPVPVHRLADAFSISRPAISRHLRVLKQAGLVAEVKKGRENLYAFKPARLDKAIAWIGAFREPAPTMPPEPAAPILMTITESAPPEPSPRRATEKRASKAQAPEAPRSQMGFDF